MPGLPACHRELTGCLYKVAQDGPSWLRIAEDEERKRQSLEANGHKMVTTVQLPTYCLG